MQTIDTRQHQADMALARVQREFDGRFLHFDVTARFRGQDLIVGGTVHYPQQAEAVVAVLAERFPEFAVQRQIRVLTTDWPVRFGEVVLPTVMGLKSPEAPPAEATTELLAGQLVRLFMRKGDWMFCQAPDGYLGWVPKTSIRPTTHKNYLQWVHGRRWRLLSPWTNGSEHEYRVGSEFRLGTRGNLHLPSVGSTPPPDPGEVVDSAHNPLREKAVEIARSFLGVPYLWGGRTDLGLDCSGFCQVVYARVGVALPRDANQQANMGFFVGHMPDFTDLLAGDLLFFMSPKTAKIFHVGISLGGRDFIHSASGEGVTEGRLGDGQHYQPHQYATQFCFARRILV